MANEWVCGRECNLMAQSSATTNQKGNWYKGFYFMAHTDMSNECMCLFDNDNPPPAKLDGSPLSDCTRDAAVTDNQNWCYAAGETFTADAATAFMTANTVTDTQPDVGSCYGTDEGALSVFTTSYKSSDMYSWGQCRDSMVDPTNYLLQYGRQYDYVLITSGVDNFKECAAECLDLAYATVDGVQNAGEYLIGFTYDTSAQACRCEFDDGHLDVDVHATDSERMWVQNQHSGTGPQFTTFPVSGRTKFSRNVCFSYDFAGQNQRTNPLLG
jgi:hypothetical protein